MNSSSEPQSATREGGILGKGGEGELGIGIREWKVEPGGEKPNSGQNRPGKTGMWVDLAGEFKNVISRAIGPVLVEIRMDW